MPHHSIFNRSHKGRKLRFELLENRRVLATFIVTNLSDATVAGPNQAPGTLRQAIYDANALSDSDTIDFTPGLSGDLRLSIAADSAIGLSAFAITTPVAIRGNAAGITISLDITAPEMRFFRVTATGNLILESINLTGGITRGTHGAASENGGAAYAGAIYNHGNLQIINSTLYNNISIGGNAGSGGNSGAAQGGSIYNDSGIVSIRNSTFSGNSVANGFGPLVARSYGGGIYSKNGTLNIDNSTITNGSAASGRLLYVIGQGTNQVAIANIRNSIIAQSDIQISAFDVNATDDLGGQLVVSGSNNLLRYHNVPPSLIVSPDNPQLGPLAANGGPTLTHALLAQSPAIDYGSNPLNLATDQRGPAYSRVIGGANDIGAFEVQNVAVPTLPGDYNKNNFVDAADYIAWRKTKGSDSPQYAGADGSGNSTIDDADFEVWRGSFGASPPASGTIEIAPSTGAAIQQPLVQTTSRLHQTALFEAITQKILLSRSESTASTTKKQPSHGPSQLTNERQHDEAILAISTAFPRPAMTTQDRFQATAETEVDEVFEAFAIQQAHSLRTHVPFIQQRPQIPQPAAASICTT